MQLAKLQAECKERLERSRPNEMWVQQMSSQLANAGVTSYIASTPSVQQYKHLNFIQEYKYFYNTTCFIDHLLINFFHLIPNDSLIPIHPYLGRGIEVFSPQP